jgi:hypothetical protein
MLETYKVEDIVPWMRTQEELQSTYDSFNGYAEKLKQFGFVALELEK